MTGPGHTAATAIAVCACLLLASCAGYRGGWESIPYVGAPPPALPESRTPFEAQQRSELILPGLTLGVAINTQVRTYDTAVYLFVLPLSVDPRTVRTQQVEAGKTRVTLRVSRTGGDFVFRPKKARLVVRGQAVQALDGLEFSMWDQAGNRVRDGGTWADRPVGDELALSDASETYVFSIDFPVPAPEPTQADITLDLSEALTAPGRPPIAPIHFLPARWKEGYT